MLHEERLARINELARKQRSATGLTFAEKAEQHALRQAYLEAFRVSLRTQLEAQGLQPRTHAATCSCCGHKHVH